MDENMNQTAINFTLQFMGLTEGSPFPNEHLLKPLVETKGFPEDALLYLLRKADREWQYDQILQSENLSLELLEKIIRAPLEFLPERTRIVDNWGERPLFSTENRYKLSIYKAIAENDTLTSALVQLLYDNAQAIGYGHSDQLENTLTIIARHKSLPPNLIIEMSSKFATTWMAEDLARRNDLPEQALLSLVKGKKGYAVDRILDAKSLPESVQLALADSDRYIVRSKLVERKDTTLNVLKYLLNRPFNSIAHSHLESYQTERAEIGRKLLRNPLLAVPKEWATEFMFDDNEKVRKYARGCTRRKTTVAKTNNSTSSTLFTLDIPSENIQENTN